MTSQATTLQTESVHALAQLLAEVHVSLSVATNEHESLAAVMRYMEGFAPSAVNLYSMLPLAGEQPEEVVLVSRFAAEPSVAAAAIGSRHQLSKILTPSLWSQNPHDLGVLVDAESDPRCSEEFRQTLRAAGQRALVVMPLYSVSHSSWQGVLCIVWNQPHTPSEEECFVYSMLMATLASFLANRRAELALREALEEASQLYAISAQLNSAQSLEALLSSAAAPAFDGGAQVALLAVVSHDAAGVPSSLTIVSGLSRERTPLVGIAGRVIPFADRSVAKPWQESSDQPLLIEDVLQDPRLDDIARALFQQFGQRSGVSLPLIVKQRLIGILSLMWPTPQCYVARDMRLYKAIARSTSLILANHLLVERMEKTLREKEEQSSLLETVLEHLPVGVFVAEVPSGRPTLANRRAVELLGRSADPSAGAESYTDTYRCVRPATEESFPTNELPLVRTITDGQLHRGEVDILGPDGVRRSLEVLSAPICDSAGVMHSALAHFTDITERKRVEGEQLRMQRELINVQAAALAERSTPIIPINNEIVVVPLIGSLDTERGDQLMDALLNGVSLNRAKVAIIDITGVRTLDTQAASMLTSAAQALRLLGVEPVLTGIRAEVAQTLVRIGVRLDGITTRNNLQSGIAHALKLTGQKSLR